MEGTFGQILYEARKAKRLTLRKLGQLVGLSPSFLSEIERGKRLPPKDEENIRDIAIVLNVNQDKFLESARKERILQKPELFQKMYYRNQNLAWGLYRAIEENDDIVLERILHTLNELNQKGEQSEKSSSRSNSRKTRY